MLNLYTKFLFATIVTVLSLMGLFFCSVLISVALDKSERPELCVGLTADECIALLQVETE